MMGKSLLTIRNLAVVPRGRPILSVPELSLPIGHTAIIGPNGAGKSTLLRALLGRYGGDIELLGKPITQAIKQRRIAWVGQHGQFNMPLTVAEYVQLGNASSRYNWFGRAADRLPEKLEHLLETFDLAHLAHRRIGSLSGGEQQRANVVRALLQNAPLLLLDEPLNHLDIRHQYMLMQYLHERRQDFSVVMVLHNLDMAANYADHVVLLDQGSVAASGSPETVMTDARLSEVYQWQIRRTRDCGRWLFQMQAA